MATVNFERGIARSAEVRRERGRLRAHVRRGGSLTLLLREEREELDAVTLIDLVRWMPGVGYAKATRILLGIPHRYLLKMLTGDQHYTLLLRITEYEHAQLARTLTRKDDHAPHDQD